MAGFFLIGSAKPAEDINWGATFSQRQAEALGLNWQEAYIVLLDELKVKKLRLIAYWDEIEPQEGQYHFEDLDWQINQAQERGVEIILTIGRKLPRWPECYEPEWVSNQEMEIKNQKLLNFIEKVVVRYKNAENIWAWQIENEPFLKFGECPELDKKFLEREIVLVRSLDSRPVILTESGELSLWFEVAKRADIVGSTMYRDVWFKEIRRFFHYPFPPIFYARKAALVKWLFPIQKVIIVELQGEPWVTTPPFSEANLEEQKKTMNIEKFRENINFAKQTGLDEFYLWGAEWWFWLRTKQDNSEIWSEARRLFAE